MSHKHFTEWRMFKFINRKTKQFKCQHKKTASYSVGKGNDGYMRQMRRCKDCDKVIEKYLISERGHFIGEYW